MARQCRRAPIIRRPGSAAQTGSRFAGGGACEAGQGAIRMRVTSATATLSDPQGLGFA